MSRRVSKICPKTDCAEKKFNERELFSHYRKFHMINELVCTECFAEFAQVPELSDHFEKWHPSLNEFRYIDEAVKDDGNNYRGYEILPKKSAPIEPKLESIDDRFGCCLCTQSFQSMTKRLWHCFIYHPGQFVTCAHCEGIFRSIYFLKEHYTNCPLKPNDSKKVSVANTKCQFLFDILTK